MSPETLKTTVTWEEFRHPVENASYAVNNEICYMHKKDASNTGLLATTRFNEPLVFILCHY